jgi:hypothetical protein
MRTWPLVESRWCNVSTVKHSLILSFLTCNCNVLVLIFYCWLLRMSLPARLLEKLIVVFFVGWSNNM